MKSNKDRQKHFSQFSSPTPDDKGYESWKEYTDRRIAGNPRFRKSLEDKYRQAISIGATQSFNGIGLLQDKELRFFFNEFNDRTWRHGFGSMPSSFNILEAFYKWNPDLFLFELLEEVEHLFSFFDFIDFLTSEHCSNSIDYFIENVEDELIYSYNIHNDVKDITFKTNDSKEYVIGGVSFVRRGNEVSMLLIAGELGDVKEFTSSLPELEKLDVGKSYLKPAEGLKQQAIGLFDREDIWKVNIYVRINLDDKTIDSRYVQKDAGNSFSTLTDDIGMLEMSVKDENTLKDLIEHQLEEINNYGAVFEVAYNCLMLPEYFDFYDDQVLPEEHPTGLFNESLRKPIDKKKVAFNSRYFYKTKDVWVLDRNIDPISGKVVIKKTELKIEKDGYWKYLKVGQVGIDRTGKPIHNRTWVEKTLSWQQTNEVSDLEITVPDEMTEDKGYIYLLRNAAHDLNIFKIGLTTRVVEERAKELSGTPSPDKFLIINRWLVSDCRLAEKIIHSRLDKYRLNPSREFFKVDLETAISVISPVIKDINAKAKLKT